MDKPTPPAPFTYVKSVAPVTRAATEVPLVFLSEAIEHGEAMAAWGAAQTIDCRTCQNHTTRSGGCMSTVLCVDAAQYKPSTPHRYWDAAMEQKKVAANANDAQGATPASADRSEDFARLRAELAEYKEDAERYRFLKARCLSEYYAEDDDGTLCIHFLCDFENYNDPDAAIDKARKS